MDVGTSSVKAIALHPDGKLLWKTSRDYEVQIPQPGYAELNPQTVLDAVKATLAALIDHQGHKPLGVGWSCAMHSLIAVDDQFEPLTPIITWLDNRSAAIAKSIRAQPEWAQALFEQTGTPIHPMSPFCKLLWMKDEAQDIFREARWLLDIKSYLFAKLGGKAVIDYGIASGTGLFNIRTLDWSTSILEQLEITPDRLPLPVSPHYCFLSLEDHLPFFAGGSDGCLANLGADCLQSKRATLTIGTSAAIRNTSNTLRYDDNGELFTYYLDEQYYIIGGATNNGGNLLKWFQSHYGEGKSIEAILVEIAQIPPGASGLLFLPWLHGERSPYWDSAAMACFIGLREKHSQWHMGRALVEGLLLNLSSILERLKQGGAKVEMIKAGGGFFRSSFGAQLAANILNCPIGLSDNAESSATGAAMQAMKSLELVKDYDAFSAWGTEDHIYYPQPDAVAFYEALKPIFNQFYPTLKELFHQLDDLNQQ